MMESTSPQSDKPYQGHFYKLKLGYFKSYYYVNMNRYTIYFYDSQRSSINQCDKPKFFFNISTVIVSKAKDSISLKDGLSEVTLFNKTQTEISILFQKILKYKKQTDIEKLILKKYQESRINSSK